MLRLSQHTVFGDRKLVMQIVSFETKISGGTAICLTTRDAFRVTQAMDFFRMLSWWSTCVSSGMVKHLTWCARLAVCQWRTEGF